MRLRDARSDLSTASYLWLSLAGPVSTAIRDAVAALVSARKSDSLCSRGHNWSLPPFTDRNLGGWVGSLHEPPLINPIMRKPMHRLLPPNPTTLIAGALAVPVANACALACPGSSAETSRAPSSGTTFREGN